MMKRKIKDIDLFKLSKIRLIHIINSLEVVNESLEDTVKDELYKTFMEKLQEHQEIKRLKKENKNLREKVRTLKQLLKGDK